MKYLLATDLDGTLLYPKRKIAVLEKSNTAFLKDFLKEGNEVILCSGRNPKMQMILSRKFKTTFPLLGCNGSYLSLDGKLIINKTPIPTQLGTDLYLDTKFKYGVQGWFLFDDTKTDYFTFTDGSFSKYALMRFGNLMRLRYKENIVYGEENFINRLKRGNVFKIMPVFGIKSDAIINAHYAYAALLDKYKDKLSVMWSNKVIEITAKNTSKGLALEEYITAQGFTKDQVLVVGDSGNDVTMFEKFPHSFCMAQSSEFIRVKANHIIEKVSDLRRYLENPFLIEKDRIKE